MQNSFHIPVNFVLMCKEIYNAKCQTHSQFICFFFLLQSYFVFLHLKNFSYSLLSTNLAPRRASHVHSCVSTVGFCAQKANKYLESWNYYHIFYLFFFCILHTLHWYIHTCPFFFNGTWMVPIYLIKYYYGELNFFAVFLSNCLSGQTKKMLWRFYRFIL